MLLCRSIGPTWRGHQPQAAEPVRQITELHEGILAPGTHLVTSRRGYMHHGIYVGRGMVVHYAGLSRFLHSGPVEEVTMSRFSRGRAVRIIEYSASKYSPQEIVQRAFSRLGEDEYQVLRNNCEHFCNWCISGRSRSTQVEGPVASTLRALVIAVHCAKRLPLMLGNLLIAAGRAVPAGR
jgi:HRAS-like suppressor 3